MAKKLSLHTLTYLVSSDNLDEGIADALISYKAGAGERGHEIVKSPIATAQPSLYNPDEVEITVRALVKELRPY